MKNHLGEIIKMGDEVQYRTLQRPWYPSYYDKYQKLVWSYGSRAKVIGFRKPDKVLLQESSRWRKEGTRSEPRHTVVWINDVRLAPPHTTGHQPYPFYVKKRKKKEKK